VEVLAADEDRVDAAAIWAAVHAVIAATGNDALPATSRLSAIASIADAASGAAC
jgi:hypothetical protein